MKKDILKQYLNSKENHNRRKFLTNTGYGILAAGVLGELTGFSAAQQNSNTHFSVAEADTTPVQLKPLNAPSEKPLPPPPAPMNPEKRIGYAIVGLGHLALGQILPAFGESKYSKPVALVSGDAEKAKKVADQYGINPKNIYNYQNYDDIKNNPEIDVVYIVLPNSMHEEFTIRAAKAGKHVLCEKPMATSSAAARRMIDACKKADKKLMIAYRIQYEPHNALAKHWTRDKKYGKVRVIESVNGQNTGDPNQWRLKKELSGGGSLPDIGLYCLNTSRFLLGEEPEWVSANMYSTPGDVRFKEVEETVLFQLGFPSGALANALCSYSVHDCKRYRCLADNGGWFGLDPAFPYKGLKVEVSEVKDTTESRYNPSVEDKDQFALEMDHMAQCIQNNQQPYTPGEEGLQDQKIMEAIYQSAKEKRVIQLERITKIDAFRGTPPNQNS